MATKEISIKDFFKPDITMTRNDRLFWVAAGVLGIVSAVALKALACLTPIKAGVLFGFSASLALGGITTIPIFLIVPIIAAVPIVFVFAASKLSYKILAP